MMTTTTTMKRKNPESSLPPGFRFHPTDEELILHYLQKKVASIPSPAVSIIADVDIYKFDPWDLPGKATFGEKEWYFFSPRDRKYPNGARPNRAAASGYWKATGTDKIISLPSAAIIMSSGRGGQVAENTTSTNIGVKKALVFYKGRPPKGVKTNWIMHEYRLADAPTYSVKPMMRPINKDSSMRLDDWVLCRIYRKSHSNLSHQQSSEPFTAAAVSNTTDHDHDQQEEDGEDEEERFVQQTLLPLTTSSSKTPPLMPQKSTSFSNLLDAMDYTLLSSFLSDPPQFSFNNNPPDPAIESSSSAGPNNTDYSNLVNQQPSFASSGYLHHKVPQNGGTSGGGLMNRPKRERERENDDEHVLMTMMNQHPSLKRSMMNSFSFANSNNNINGSNHNNGIRTTPFSDHHVGVAPTNHDQYGFLNPNQQLLLSHHFQFQG